MNLTDREETRLLKLLEEIDKEAAGRSRGFYIQNRTRQIRLITKKAKRRERESEAKARSQGNQLLLFD